MFGWKGALTREQTEQITSAKQVIYDAFKAAVAAGAAKEKAGILVDEQFGAQRPTDCEKVVAAARRNGRSRVGCIVLGRGENDSKVRGWLTTAAGVPGFISFAVCRTSFCEPLLEWRDRKIIRDEAVTNIADRYRQYVRLFEETASVAALRTTAEEVSVEL